MSQYPDCAMPPNAESEYRAVNDQREILRRMIEAHGLSDVLCDICVIAEDQVRNAPYPVAKGLMRCALNAIEDACIEVDRLEEALNADRPRHD